MRLATIVPRIHRSFNAYRAVQVRFSSNAPLKSLPSLSMQGKVCVVTGAARGLGLEFCRAFVQSGCTSLAILDLKESEARAAAAELVSSACVDDLNIIGLECDVSLESSVQKAYADVMSTFARVDSVVAAAGIVENYSALDYPIDRVKFLYDVNVHGAFLTAREAARNMIPLGGGTIVLVGSMSANIVNVPQVSPDAVQRL